VEPRLRLTLTLPAINYGRRVWFLVSGAQKTEAFELVGLGHRTPPPLPGRRQAPARPTVGQDLGPAPLDRAGPPSGLPAEVIDCPGLGVRPVEGELVWWVDEAAL